MVGDPVEERESVYRYTVYARYFPSSLLHFQIIIDKSTHPFIDNIFMSNKQN